MPKRPSSSARTGSARQPFLFGFNDSSVRNGWATAVQDATLNAEVGTTVSRVGVGWRWAEPRKGHYDLKAFDDQYRELLARGIRPLWFPTFAPDWATETGKPCDATKKLCHFPPGRAHIADYASFVAMLARRYPKSAGIEVWNEPNQKFFWQPYPDPVLYADMLKATYRAVKAVNPSMPVVNGGLADNTSYDYGIPPKPYAEAMYANGLKSYMDGFAFHPYPHLTGLFDQTVADMRAVRHAAGDDAKPFWITESGWTTTGHLSGWPASWILTEAQQATSLVALYRRIYAMPDVRAFMVHTLIEPPGNRDTSPGVGYGVVHADLTPKPAFCALAALRGEPSPCR